MAEMVFAIEADSEGINPLKKKVVELIGARTNFAVLTARPEEWQGVQENQYCSRVSSAKGVTATELIQILYDWVRQTTVDKRQPAALLIDELEQTILWDGPTIRKLCWFFNHGEEENIHVLATVDPKNINLLPQVFRDYLSQI